MQRLAALIAALAVNVAAADDSSIILGHGMQKVLRIPELQRISVGDGSILDARVVEGDAMVLTGSRPGRTTLLVWRKNGERLSYQVTVRGAGATAGPTEPAIALRVHEQRVLDVRKLKRVSIEDAAIAEVKTVGDSQVIITGLAAGRTSLTVWGAGDTRTAWEITVSEAPKQKR